MGRASKYIRNIPVLGRARGNSLEGWSNRAADRGNHGHLFGVALRGDELLPQPYQYACTAVTAIDHTLPNSDAVSMG